MNKTLIALLLSGAAGMLSAQPEQVVGGPYVVQAGPRSATVMWVIEAGQASVGDNPGKLDKTVPILRSRQIVLSGLKPGSPTHSDADYWKRRS